MSQTVLPTTRAQVSGHRFLRRRVEHGLVFGDIRMIHDPLAARSRALLFGVVAVVMISLGAGLLAWLRPAADPGEAPILQAADGALFVRVDDRVHPVTNLASARLIAGGAGGAGGAGAADPARVGESVLAGFERGVPVGIHPAPLVLGEAPEETPAWSACYGDSAGTDTGTGTVTVAVGEHTNPLGGHRGVLATGAGADWLLTSAGRHRLPHRESPEGRTVRRALGITPQTPRWEPPVEVLNAVTELDPVILPDPLPGEVLDTRAGLWALLAEGIAPVTPAQAEVLAAHGVPHRVIPRAELADYPDTTWEPQLPPVAPLFLDPREVTVCATDGRVATLLSDTRPVRLSGSGVADEFRGGAGTAWAVDTGHGHHVVDTTGLRHPVPERADLAALGLGTPVAAPWSVLRLLPEGPPLSREAALQASY